MTDADRPVTGHVPEHVRAGHTVREHVRSDHSGCDHPTTGPEGVKARALCRAERPNPEQ